MNYPSYTRSPSPQGRSGRSKVQALVQILQDYELSAVENFFAAAESEAASAPPPERRRQKPKPPPSALRKRSEGIAAALVAADDKGEDV